MSGLLLTVYLVLVFWTFTDYGISWDDQWHATYGDNILKWYSSGFRDRAAIDDWNLRFYGGFFDVLAQLASAVSPVGVFATRHLASAMFALIALVAAGRLADRLAGARAAFFAVLFLLLTPSFYGHAFMNPKDIPFAALFTVSLYYIIVAVGAFPSLPTSLVVKLGVAIGLTLGVRVGGITLLAYLAFAVCCWLVINRPPAGASPILRTPALRRLGLTLLQICALAYLVMLPWWPAAQASPIMGPLKALWKSTHSDFGATKVLFEGALTPATELPWHYLITWHLISLPEFYFAALAAGTIVAAIAIPRWVRSAPRVPQFIRYVVLALAVLCPLAHAFIARPILYDGARQFLFILPPLAVLSGIAIARLLDAAVPVAVKAAVVVAALASAALTIIDMVQLHPYQYVFFNRLIAGGLRTAANSFETDYWGLSYKEGVEWITAHYAREDGKRLRVGSCSGPASTTYFLPSDRFEFVGRYPNEMRATLDLYLATTRWKCHERVPGRVVHVVERLGTPLLYVKEVPHDQ